jgi:hypothetical protein
MVKVNRAIAFDGGLLKKMSPTGQDRQTQEIVHGRLAMIASLARSFRLFFRTCH